MWRGRYRGKAVVYSAAEGTGEELGTVTAELWTSTRGEARQEGWRGRLTATDEQVAEAMRALPTGSRLQLELPGHPRESGGYCLLADTSMRFTRTGGGLRARPPVLEVLGDGARPAGLEL